MSISNSPPRNIVDNSQLFTLYSSKNTKEIQIGSNNIAYLYSASKMLHLSSTPLSVAAEVLRNVRNTLSVDNLFEILQKLNPEFDNDNPYETELFQSIYEVLSLISEEMNTVDLRQVVVIVMMLCKGSTSEKFRSIFEFLQVVNGETRETEEAISVVNLLSLFSSSLALILLSNKDLRIDDVAQISYEYSQAACRHIEDTYPPRSMLCLNEEGTGNEYKECIDIEEFSDWFKQFGSQYAVWLEFLDLRSTIRVLAEDDEHQSSTVASVIPVPSSIAGTVDSNTTQNNIFDFVLSGVNEKLLISESDVRLVIFLSEKTGLCELTCQDVLPAFEKYAISGTLSLNGYERVLGDICDMSELNDEEAKTCTEYFQTIYQSFDRHNVRSVDVKELFPGFSLLLKGSKSEKLSQGFLLNDSNHDQLLSRREMWRLIRSYLTVFFALNREKSYRSAEDIYDTIDSISIEITAQMFGAISEEISRDLSFVQFGCWYNDVGHFSVAWLELLDLKKWPDIPSSGDVENNSDEELEEENDEAIVRFPLQDSNDYIVIDAPAVALLQQILQSSTLSQSPCDNLFFELLQVASQGLISSKSFHQVLEPILPEDPDAANYILSVFDKIFRLFDYEDNRTADVLEIASSLCLFCAGSKSEKLCGLFKAFDKTGSQELSMSRLTVFLESLLITIGVITNSNIEQSVSSTVAFVIDSIKKYFSFDHQGCINLEQFGAWYNNGGSSIIPWLELMNFNKWPLDLLKQEDQTANEVTIFHFPLIPTSSILPIGREEVTDLQYTLQTTQFHLYPVTHLKSVLKVNNTIIDHDTFDSLIPDLVPRGDFGKSRFILLQIYDYLKSTSKGYVAVNDLIVALSLFTSSIKTEKLALCFDLYATDEGINERDFIHFLSSFLLMYLYFHDPRSVDLTNDIFVHVGYITEKVFKYYKASGQFIKFEQFADWYNQEGNKDIPWLELLDLKKWPDMTIDLPQRYQPIRSQGEPNFAFTLNSLNAKLFITPSDVARLTEFLEATKLYTYLAEQLQDKICSCTSDRNLTKDEYLFYLPDICAQLPQGDKKKSILLLLTRVFSMFDRNDNEMISVFELASAFSLFARGNKSDKLSSAFDLFNPNDNGEITREELYHYIYSFISPILAFNDLYLDETITNIRPIAEITAKELALSVYHENHLDLHKSISFVQFARWYSLTGFHEAPWIELLDLKKWSLGIAVALQEEEQGDEDENEDDTSDTEGSIPTAPAPAASTEQPLLPPVSGTTPVLTCNVTDQNGNSLGFTLIAEDAQAHALLLSESHIHENTVDNVRECFAHVLGQTKQVTMNDLLDIIDALAPEPSGEYLHGTMMQLFNLIAGPHESVERYIIETALLPLIKGKKTEKLVYACTIFSQNDMVLPPDLFALYLASLLSGIIVCKTQPPTFVEIMDLCNAVVAGILTDLGKSDSDDIDFEEFANWYGSKGYQIIPWLELLDITKWPHYETINTSSISRSSQTNKSVTKPILTDDEDKVDTQMNTSSHSKHSQTEPRETENDDENENECDAFVLNNTYELVINETDCEYLRNLLQLSKLTRFTPRDIHDAFVGASQDGKLSKDQFEQALKVLIPQTNLSVHEQTFLKNALAQFYYVFVTADDKNVPVECVSTAISLLSTGSKSTKLSEAFYQFTLQDKISKKDLCQFLYSFLIAICMIDEEAAKNCKIIIHAKQECDTIVQQIYTKKNLDDNSLLSFEDFANWYSTDLGDLAAPWIELLDLHKWPFTVIS